MSVPIVVVDDSEIDRYLLKRVLKSLGLDVKFVQYEDGEDFVQVIRDQQRLAEEVADTPPRILVFLDVNMPRMDGFEVLEAIREEFEQTNPFVFVTMYTPSSRVQDREDAMKYPFVKDYLVKPIAAEKIKRLLEDLYPGLS